MMCVMADMVWRDRPPTFSKEISGDSNAQKWSLAGIEVYQVSDEWKPDEKIAPIFALRKARQILGPQKPVYYLVPPELVPFGEFALCKALHKTCVRVLPLTLMPSTRCLWQGAHFSNSSVSVLSRKPCESVETVKALGVINGEQM